MTVRSRRQFKNSTYITSWSSLRHQFHYIQLRTIF